ncbi:MAG: hypothetical protein K2P78_00830 [Gemmataceae bacterium]|nr:hypothetical protein [Gemmataceae bacterium]
MANEHEGDEMTDTPDWGWSVGERMPDGGPRYAETPAELHAPRVAEPWNAATALLFVGIVLAWAWRLRGRYRAFPFLAACMPVLLVGGVGGALYHGLRSNRAFLMMDVIPISVLGFAGAVFLTLRLTRRWVWGFAGVAVALAVYIVVNRLLFLLIAPESRQVAISLNYLALAALILIPIGLTLARSRFRHGGWIVGGVLSFATAMFFRWLDGNLQPLALTGVLPMGSHWLWHTFGAVSTALVVEYFFRVEAERPPPAADENGAGVG